jgi:hypothetical protein
MIPRAEASMPQAALDLDTLPVSPREPHLGDQQQIC